VGVGVGETEGVGVGVTEGVGVGGGEGAGVGGDVGAGVGADVGAGVGWSESGGGRSAGGSGTVVPCVPTPGRLGKSVMPAYSMPSGRRITTCP